MESCIAIYARVSSRQQDLRSQEPDLKRWAEVFATTPVKWYTDKATGRTMDRPGWRRLEEDMATGRVSKIVVWRLDRLGRTAAGLTALFEDLQRRGVGFESLRDKIDLSTASGRLMANVLASVAAYENEIRSERIVAGQEVARSNGKRWGGSRQGRQLKVTAEQKATILRLRTEGAKIAAIARATGLTRPTIYSVLRTSQAQLKECTGGIATMP
jgi:DNA invertase Pin-like site-specific DNA recombinase